MQKRLQLSVSTLDDTLEIFLAWLQCNHNCLISGNLQVEQICFSRACDNLFCCIGLCLQNTHVLLFDFSLLIRIFSKIIYFHHKSTYGRDSMYYHNSLMPYFKKRLWKVSYFWSTALQTLFCFWLICKIYRIYSPISRPQL